MDLKTKQIIISKARSLAVTFKLSLENLVELQLNVFLKTALNVLFYIMYTLHVYCESSFVYLICHVKHL